MLNTATPILQMKTSGVDLSTIQTMIVTIRSVNETIIKGNSDIEVDNDLIIVFLANDESKKLNDGFYNISISATNIDGMDVSDILKVMWTKKGSMSRGTGSGGSGADLTNYYTKPEVDALIVSIPAGKDGFSPIATVMKENGVTTVSIQDENGFTTSEILDGEDGRDGIDGITPHVGENGNWFIGTVDTGIKAQGIDGKDGADGFSPKIKENTSNSSTSYRLDITTKDGSFTTPNLKGKDGDGSDEAITIEEVRQEVDNAIEESLNGVVVQQNEKGEWGYIPPGADTVIPFKSSSVSGGIEKNYLKIGTTESETVGAIFLMPDEGEDFSDEINTIALLSNISTGEENTVSCDDENNYRIGDMYLNTKDTGEIGCIWIE